MAKEVVKMAPKPARKVESQVRARAMERTDPSQDQRVVKVTTVPRVQRATTEKAKTEIKEEQKQVPKAAITETQKQVPRVVVRVVQRVVQKIEPNPARKDLTTVARAGRITVVRAAKDLTTVARAGRTTVVRAAKDLTTVARAGRGIMAQRAALARREPNLRTTLPVHLTIRWHSFPMNTNTNR